MPEARPILLKHGRYPTTIEAGGTFPLRIPTSHVNTHILRPLATRPRVAGLNLDKHEVRWRIPEHVA